MALKIGNVVIRNPVALAPMAGVTDLPFRLLCKEQGCGLLYTEMISAKALFYENRNTKPLMQIDEREHPIALQLFGSEPKLMGRWRKRLKNSRLIYWILIWAARFQKLSIMVKAVR